MNWLKLESKEDLDHAIESSFLENVYGIAIFKHSTRCSISSLAKMRLKSFWDFNEELPIYLLDLLNYRELSNLISEQFEVIHESPQFILIKEGKSIFNNSHTSISANSVRSFLKNKD